MWLHTIKNLKFYFSTLVDDPKCPVDDLASVVHRWKINPRGSIPQSSFHGFMVNSGAFKSISIMSSWYFKVHGELTLTFVRWMLFAVRTYFPEVRLRLRGYNWLKSTLLYGACMGWIYLDWKVIDKNIFQKQKADMLHLFVNFLLIEASNQLVFSPSRNLLHHWTPLVVALSRLLLDCVFSRMFPFHIRHKHLSVLIPQTN